jgi:hypothetical protein
LAIAGFGVSSPAIASDPSPIENRLTLLRTGNCPGCNLQGSDLSGMRLRGANLSGANLSGVILTDADLSGANLSGANLSRAYLWGSNLSGAILDRANLCDAVMPIGAVSNVGCSASQLPSNPDRPTTLPSFPSGDGTLSLAISPDGRTGLATGMVTGDQQDVWNIRASSDGTLQLIIESNTNQARFQILNDQGEAMGEPTGEQSLRVTAGTTYAIAIRSQNGDRTTYRLNAELSGGTPSQPLNPPANRPARPEYLAINPRTLVGSGRGTLPANGQQIWIVDVVPGTLNILLESNSNSARFDLVAPNGRTLARNTGEASTRVNTAGDYQIVITSPNAASDYQIVVEIQR